MKARIAVLAGDGIGPEVTAEAVRCLEAIAARFGHEFTLDYAPMGAAAMDQCGEPLPAATLEAARAADAILFGAISDPRYSDPSIKVRPEQAILALRRRRRRRKEASVEEWMAGLAAAPLVLLLAVAAALSDDARLSVALGLVAIWGWAALIAHGMLCRIVVWLYFGRVAVEKGIDDFLGLDLPGTKLVVGDGPATARLRRQYADVVFTGFRYGEELASHVAAADVFVFPGRADTFGLVLIEAMACGVPVAAYPVPGPIGVVVDGVTGVLHHDLRAASLAALDLDPAACRRHALNYTWQAGRSSS